MTNAEHSFDSFELTFDRRPRRVRTFVPRGVEQEPPVLILFDGQNVLDDHGSFSGGWHAHRAIEKLAKTVRRPIVVAIDHGNEARTRELWSELDAFLHFVTRAALPAAEHRLGLRFDASARVIGGASMGGLASLAAIARHPELFRGAMAMSPSAWIAPSEVHHELGRARLHPEARLYLDVGHRESERMVREAARVAGLLASRHERSKLMWRPDGKGKHHERDWRRRLPKALWFLFRR